MTGTRTALAVAALTFFLSTPPFLAASPAVAAEPGTFSGPGFDTCTAPPAATMQAWLASPYRAVGIYFGGDNRACLQPELTPAWVAAQRAAGWHLIPIYLGPQASCTTSAKPNRIDNTRAAAQGRAAAEDAVRAASALGLPRDSVLIYDMEAYRTDDAACRAGVLAFLSAWTARLHDLAYLSGFYSSLSSGVADQVANYRAPRYVRPDYLDFARWDGVATVGDVAIPAGYWAPHRRIKQYRGDHLETWGGVTLNIDNDVLDVAPPPPARSADFSGNGWADVLARSGGALYLYPGNGTYADTAARVLIGGSGWQAMSALIRIGDLDADGREDVIARQGSNGALWFYPGRGTGLGRRTQLGTGWNGMREITPIGDLTGDGRPDLIAALTGTGRLYLYPGRAGPALGSRIPVGSGWGALSELTGAGDFDRDGRPDLIARSADGRLWLYPGRSTGFGTRRPLGTGWNGYRDLVGTGDFDRDGFTDIAAVRVSDGTLFHYPGRGGALGTRTTLATGFGSLRPIL